MSLYSKSFSSDKFSVACFFSQTLHLYSLKDHLKTHKNIYYRFDLFIARVLILNLGQKCIRLFGKVQFLFLIFHVNFISNQAGHPTSSPGQMTYDTLGLH